VEEAVRDRKPLKGVIVKWQLTDIGCIYGTCLLHKDALAEGIVMQTSRVVHMYKDEHGLLIAETLNSRYILL
jgi:hypothetical protein